MQSLKPAAKQYKVENGDVLYIEKLAPKTKPLWSSRSSPFAARRASRWALHVENAKVSGKVLKSGKGKKITVFTYKAKKGEKRKMGHRQPYTKVQIESISL